MNVEKVKDKTEPSITKWVSWVSPFLLVVAFLVLWNLGLMQKIVDYNHGRAFAGASLFFGVYGIILTVIALVEAVNQTNRLKEQTVNLGLITESLSTTYIGQFPDHLGEIIRIVQKAKRNISIMTDCADYGSFSAPLLHDQLVRAIETAHDKNPSLSVQMLVMLEEGEDIGATISRNSPYYGKKYNDLILGTTFSTCLAEYLRFHEIDTKPLTDAQWQEMLLKTLKRTQDRLEERGTEIRHSTNDKYTRGFFFWLQDSEEAVFLFSHVGREKQELAFRTRDSTLIGVFRSAFDQSWQAVGPDA